ncbi:hypothetical protein F5877DRAFT_73456 [Lentinula edodes]|nr:hypothetical protein F5877DRAFT_73456 [Lentinula edodes]
MSFTSINAASGTSSSVGLQPPLNFENPDIDKIPPTVEDPSLGQLSLFKSIFGCSRDLAFARRFLEIHRDPGQRTQYSLPSEQWLSITSRIEQSTNSTVALLKLNILDDHYQQELDRSLIPPSPPPAWGHSPLLPSSIPKKQKRLAKLDPVLRIGSDSKRRRSVQHLEEEGTSNYRCVVLVLRPPPVPNSELPPSPPELSHPAAEVFAPPSAKIPSRSQGSSWLHCQVTPSGSSEQFAPLADQFAPPNAVEDLV